MNRTMCISLIAGVLAAGALADAAFMDGRDRLLARRAAELDAYRKLAEQVQGLHLSSTTTVRDFVTESDEIVTSVFAFLRGARTVAVRDLADGTCEVDMELPVERIITELQRIYTEHYSGRRFTVTDFERIREFVRIDVVRATGTGAAETPAAGRPVRTPDTGSLPSIWKGIPPQERLLARRAALVDGYRKLAEQVYGLQIGARTTVRDFALEDDVIRTSVNAIVRGAHEIEVHYTADGVVEVDVAVTVERVVTTLERAFSESRRWGRTTRIDVERIRRSVQQDVIVVTGTGAARQKPRQERAAAPGGRTDGHHVRSVVIRSEQELLP